jgi:hypothetical protein
MKLHEAIELFEDTFGYVPEKGTLEFNDILLICRSDEEQSVISPSKRADKPQRGDGGNLETTLEKTGKFLGFNDPVIPPRVKKWLSTNADRRITSITIVREPLTGLGKILNFLTKGEAQRQLTTKNYNTFYHLYILVNLDDLTQWKIGRNGRFRIQPFRKLKEGSEVRTGDRLRNRKITIGQLFENFRKHVGGYNKIMYYNPLTNNCQHFVRDLLKGSKLLLQGDEQFIMQDVVGIFQSMPKTSKLIQHLTRIGFILDTAFTGGEI